MGGSIERVQWETHARRWRACAIIFIIATALMTVAAYRSGAFTIAASPRTLIMRYPCAAESLYEASARREVFHNTDCRHVGRINPDNLICFNTREEAIEAGFRPCGVCSP